MKIAFLVDSCSISKYYSNLINDLIGDGINILIIENQIPTKKNFQRKTFRNLFNKALLKFIYTIESKRLIRTVYNDHYANIDIQNLEADFIKVNPIISETGQVYSYSSNDLNEIANHNIDLIIRTGKGILRGGILSISKYGVFSLHCGDNNTKRGRPAGFWEVFEKCSKTGFIIQKLNDNLDAGEIYISGNFPTQSYWQLNYAATKTRAMHYFKKLIIDIKNNNYEKQENPISLYGNRLYKMPNNWDLILYIHQTILSKLLNKILNLFMKDPNGWSIGYSRGGWREIAFYKAKTLKNPCGKYLADPFLLMNADDCYCLVEEYDKKKKKGSIGLLQLVSNHFIYLEKVLEEDFHLSFPYVFTYNSKIYMVPESAQANQIRIYECTKFPNNWELKVIAMDSVSAADTIIFEYDSLWWLLTSINPIGGEHCSELSLFYADNPLTNHWTECKTNPVYIDPEKGRNGGFLYGENKLFRVAQKQGFLDYGKSISIYKVEELNTRYFKEKLMIDVSINFDKKIKKIHHLSSTPDITVFDFHQ